MKELLISQDSNTFTSALKGIRSNPSMGSSSRKTSRSNQSGFMQKIAFSHMHSPRVNIVKRKNLTLHQLYTEYQANPGTQYVIRLKNQTQVKNGGGTFDHWITNLKQHKEQQSSVYFFTQHPIDGNNQSSQSNRQKLERQISQSLLKMAGKMQKRESQSTEQSIRQEGVSMNRQTKYSFSQYFSQYSPRQNRQNTIQPEVITKLSIGNGKNHHQTSTIDKIQSAKQTYVPLWGRDMQSNHENKQNISAGINQMPSHANKIVGLQFSKNKRFKSTKKKRKN